MELRLDDIPARFDQTDSGIGRVSRRLRPRTTLVIFALARWNLWRYIMVLFFKTSTKHLCIILYIASLFPWKQKPTYGSCYISICTSLHGGCPLLGVFVSDVIVSFWLSFVSPQHPNRFWTSPFTFKLLRLQLSLNKDSCCLSLSAKHAQATANWTRKSRKRMIIYWTVDWLSNEYYSDLSCFLYLSIPEKYH